MNSFNRIAPYYDLLARLVFGKNIVDAQEYFLPEIKEGDRILILGGGTGWILESIFKITKPVEFWYVDSSLKMIEKAKSRIFPPGKVHFIHGTEKEIPVDEKFDVVITNFFLDVFPPNELSEVIKCILEKKMPEGVWICTDFVNTGKWKHNVLLKSMYYFFRLTSKLKNNSLADWKAQLTGNGLKICDEKSYYDGFIMTTVFRCSS